MNPWINHVKQFASKHNISYSDALKNPNCKSSYKVGGLLNKTGIIRSLEPNAAADTILQELRDESMVGHAHRIMQKKLNYSKPNVIKLFNNENFQQRVREESGVDITNGRQCAIIFSQLGSDSKQRLIRFAERLGQDRTQSEMYGEDNSRYKEQGIQEMMQQFGF